MQEQENSIMIKSSGWDKNTKKPLLQDVKWLLKDSIYVKEIETTVLEDQFHFHNAYEIALIIKGKGTRIIGDSIENFADGDLVLLGPQVPHIAYFKEDAGSSPIFQAAVVYFHPDWLTESQLNSENLSKLRKLLDDISRGIKIFGVTKTKVAKIIIQLKNCTGLESIIKLLDILEIVSRSYEYECLASEGYCHAFRKKDIQRLNNVYQYVRDHFTDEISLVEIANVANMTPTSFCKYFRKQTQKTFSNFVNEVRVGYACKLLFDEDLTISQICYKCGFNNLTSFNICFKEFTKKNPSEYRLNLKSKK
jgi:AraC-like DNA-binding protein